TQCSIGRPAILCCTFAVSLFIRVPRPAAMMKTIGACLLLIEPNLPSNRTIDMKAALLVLAACGAPQPLAPSADGGVRWAPIVDSHVHLTYWPVADRLAAHGVLAA